MTKTGHTRTPVIAIAAVLATTTYLAVQTSAHSIDYLAAAISPAAEFNGSSGNFSVTDPVAGGSSISFSLTYSINTQGSTTTYPRTVTFGASTESKPSGAADASVSLTPDQVTFTNASTTALTSVTITAPTTPGGYSVKIAPTSGTGGSHGLSSGGGITVSFTVAEANSSCTEAATVLTVPTVCVLYREASASVTAYLTSSNVGLAGKLITFKDANGNTLGSEITSGTDGAATLTFNPSALPVGNHTVTAEFEGDCDHAGTTGNGSVGVSYVFLGFQQPINADGSSVFGGRTVPVKIRIADANGQPVTNAEARVYFEFGTAAITGTDAEPVANTNGDSGNLMRYDTSANQYIFNWDVNNQQNGTHTVWVDLGEDSSCSTPHTATLSLKRKK